MLRYFPLGNFEGNISPTHPSTKGPMASKIPQNVHNVLPLYYVHSISHSCHTISHRSAQIFPPGAIFPILREFTCTQCQPHATLCYPQWHTVSNEYLLEFPSLVPWKTVRNSGRSTHFTFPHGNLIWNSPTLCATPKQPVATSLTPTLL
jgi:hypothetical protein